MRDWWDETFGRDAEWADRVGGALAVLIALALVGGMAFSIASDTSSPDPACDGQGGGRYGSAELHGC
jgi:hypothetical protein